MKLTIETLQHYVTEEGECMLWKCGKNGDGYPQARIDGQPVNIRAWVFRMSGKKRSDSQVVTSNCGNRDCVNPAHLIAATRSSTNAAAYRSGNRNAQQEIAARRERAAKQGGVWAHKLTLEKAREIRALKGTNVSQQQIAAQYGVSRSTVGEIWSGRRWRESSFSVFTWAST